jgi:tetratricopeptide (TPR) repeat protein
MATRWTAFPHPAAAYRFDAATLRTRWERLHLGDAEPLPADDAVVAAWLLFHAGDFEKAVDAGLTAHARGMGAGMTVANKAQAVYATYLEKSETRRLELLHEVAQRAESRVAEAPREFNAHYCLAFALGRYSQGISIAKALSLGLGSKVKQAIDTTIRLQPRHADAYTALGAYHAEIIDKVGSLLGLTQGASKDAGLAAFRTARKLNPGSAITMIEYANGLMMLEGDKRMQEATELYEKAAAAEPADATEKLEVEVAKAALADG